MGCRAEGYLSCEWKSCVQRGAKREVAIYDGRRLIVCSTWTESTEGGKHCLYLPSGDMDSIKSKLTCLHQMLPLSNDLGKETLEQYVKWTPKSKG